MSKKPAPLKEHTSKLTDAYFDRFAKLEQAFRISAEAPTKITDWLKNNCADRYACRVKKPPRWYPRLNEVTVAFHGETDLTMFLIRFPEARKLCSRS